MLAVQDNIRICVKGFGFAQYHIAWSKDGKKTPLITLVIHLKIIIEEEHPDTIPDKPPTFVPQRPNFPILGQLLNKVKEINEKANDNDAELIAKANEMFQQNEDNGITSVYSAMQERTVPNLNNMIGTQIEYLCEYTDTDDKKQKFCHWCVGTILDVSTGTDDKKMEDQG